MTLELALPLAAQALSGAWWVVQELFLLLRVSLYAALVGLVSSPGQQRPGFGVGAGGQLAAEPGRVLAATHFTTNCCSPAGMGGDSRGAAI